MVRGLQERAARALPAEKVERVGGWWLRYAAGPSWWVGTVLPHGDAAGPLARRVGEVEAFYAGHGVVPRFQITAGACPDGLDGFLSRRGYRRESEMSLQAAPVSRILARAPGAGPTVRLDDHPTPPWFEVWQRVHGHGDDGRSELAMLDRVQQPSAYASALLGDEVVAVGRAVFDAGWTGLFGMATLPHARGRGAARNVLAALAGWGRAQGATHMYLQVERGNAAAVGLYAGAGFGEVCGYHYRVAG
jgi:N-acetylglutamate synthase